MKGVCGVSSAVRSSDASIRDDPCRIEARYNLKGRASDCLETGPACSFELANQLRSDSIPDKEGNSYKSGCLKGLRLKRLSYKVTRNLRISTGHSDRHDCQGCSCKGGLGKAYVLYRQFLNWISFGWW